MATDRRDFVADGRDVNINSAPGEMLQVHQVVWTRPACNFYSSYCKLGTVVYIDTVLMDTI